jgi:hypothetical protein
MVYAIFAVCAIAIAYFREGRTGRRIAIFITVLLVQNTVLCLLILGAPFR